MIIDGEKYACEACVRGHRVSNCQHSDRPLQNIRKKGRPVSRCANCRARKSRRVKCTHLQPILEGHSQCCNHGGACSCSQKASPSSTPPQLAISDTAPTRRHTKATSQVRQSSLIALPIPSSPNRPTTNAVHSLPDPHCIEDREDAMAHSIKPTLIATNPAPATVQLASTSGELLMASTPKETLRKRTRKRVARACTSCRSRKVRRNVDEGVPCMNCNKRGDVDYIRESKTRKKHYKLGSPTNTTLPGSIDLAGVNTDFNTYNLKEVNSTDNSFILGNNAFEPTNALISISACPSLSLSPSLYAQSVSSEFCDPRNLTMTATSSMPADFLGLKEEDATSEQRSPISSSSISQATFDFSTALPNMMLSTFGDLSDLEAEANLTGFLDIEQVPTAVSECGCSSSSVVSFSYISFIGEDLTFNRFPFDLPADLSTLESNSHRDKRFKKSITTAVNTVATSTSAQSSAKTHSSGIQTPVANPAPANRCGRKQSLTEDPSKTFVCDLCNRRFRRLEHLKRHYRSLHTQEKPFECNECGKKFSRSDNLAQHARTHDSGAIVMEYLIRSGDCLEPKRVA